MAINPSIATAIKNPNTISIATRGPNRYMFSAIMTDTKVYYWNRDTRWPKIWELDARHVSFSPTVPGRIEICPWSVKEHGILLPPNSDDHGALVDCWRNLLNQRR